nr:E-beta-farnesene synthase [Tanacetum cinerariifolium]
MPHIRWVPIEKSNCYLDVEKSQSNPIYKIAFWDTVRYEKTAGCYKCQLDEQWFDLTKDTLRDALQITPVSNNKAFSSPPSSEALINFVNELGYPKLVRNLSNGVVNRAHLNYAERIWEDFTQSIPTFIEDKKNLAQHTHKKNKATLIVILSIRFTKLIIYHLQRKHKFHPRPDSSLRLPNEEPVLGYLKFSAKGTKIEVFGMPIPGNLITADIQGKSYYQEYLAKVTKHQRYLAGEIGSDPDSPAPKPFKTTKKSKPTVPKASLRPPVTKPASSQQTEPRPVPAKTQGKKRKLVIEISDKPSSARKSRPSLVLKQRKPISSLRSVDEFMAECIPEKEPRVDDEEADMPKKKSPAGQYIFQRRTSTTIGSSGHDESSSLYVELWLTDSEVDSDEDVLGIDAGVQGKSQAGPNPDDQDKGQAGPNPNEQAEGQAGPNPCDAEASQPLPSPVVQAGSDLEYMDLEVQENLKLMVKEHLILEEPASSSRTLSSLQYLTKDLSFGDLFFNDKPMEADNEKTTTETEVESMMSVIIQQDTSSIPPMTTPVIDLTSRPESPNVHQLLKASATKTTTTTTTIHPPPSQPQQSTTDSMLMKRIGELEHIMANLIQDNKHLEERLDSHGVRLYTLENLDIPQQETNSYTTHKDHKMLYEALEKSMNRDHSEELLKDLAEARKKKRKRDVIHQKRHLGLHLISHPLLPPTGPSRASRSPGASGSSQMLPPPPSTNQEGQSHGYTAPSSSNTAASAEYQAWTTTDTRLRPSVSLTLTDLQMDDDMAPDAQAQSSDDEDIRNAHIPNVNLRQDWWKQLEEEKPATPEPAWSIPSSDVPVPKNNWASTLVSPIHLLQRTRYSCKLYQMEECHKLLTDSVDDSILRHNVSKPLPLGGPP